MIQIHSGETSRPLVTSSLVRRAIDDRGTYERSTWCKSTAAAAAHQHHHLIESGSEKREGYRTSVSTKIRSVSNLCMNPNPLSPRSPFFSTNWSAVSHPSQRVIPLRHVSVTKCPLFADLSPRSPFPRPVSGFPNKNT